jgi:hypothetical protein
MAVAVQFIASQLTISHIFGLARQLLYGKRGTKQFVTL